MAILEDAANGLNENRKSLNKIFDMVEKGEVGAVIVAFKDRLTRFGFKYLERYFAPHNVKIEVVNEEPKNAYQDRGPCSFGFKLCRKALWFEKPQVREGG
ncbi:MAG: recombinase family protein [Candidatus Jordarchaeales archaeon]